MKGYQLTFFTQQDRKHGHEPLAEWLLLTARRLGIQGATIIPASEGYGHDRRLHSAHFFELADQPQEIVMAATEENVSRLFDTLQQEGVHLFYMKTPIEFGVIGEP
ncbi:MAG: hypothetical protein BWK73_10190 [Thiothrix lacustris]|uniref:Uncharacterized protein n=1 Tax=Thiothrix lacustris TaxID=525917 RepID=A0A1Y1QUF2_9GAMM|nr:MAG: hypothetical protein BWK73_10190 [Thiothrix lacustris]